MLESRQHWILRLARPTLAACMSAIEKASHGVPGGMPPSVPDTSGLLPSVSAIKGSLWRSSSMSGVGDGLGMRKVTPQPEMSTSPPESTSMEAWAPAGCRWSRGKLPPPPSSQTIRTQSAVRQRQVRCGGVEPESVGRALHTTGLFAGCMSGRWFQHDVGPFWNVVGGRWDPIFQEVCGVG